MKKRIISTILASAIALTLMPTISLPVTAVESDARSINLGTNGIAVRDWIYYGNYDSLPVKWRVLSLDGNGGTYDVANAQPMFLLSENIFANTKFDASYTYDDNSGDYYRTGTSVNANTYSGSDAQEWCKNFAGKYETVDGSTTFTSQALTETEYKAILATTKSDGTGTLDDLTYGESSLTSEKVFFLSGDEAGSSTYGFINSNSRIAYKSDGRTVQQWWLRSHCADGSIYAGIVAYSGTGNYLDVKSSEGARPAFNLDTSKVLFSSAAENGKSSANGYGTLTKVDGSAPTACKLTLLDSTRTFTVDETALTAAPGSTAIINYSDIVHGTNEYISAMICDGQKVLYYGRIMKTDNSAATVGSVGFIIPANLAAGNYTLKIFNEQYNDDFQTDYSSAFKNITLTVSSPYGVTVGGTTVTAANKGDVLGDGKVSYDPNSNTLTLNNARITTQNVNGSLNGIKLDGSEQATLKLIGRNTISGSGSATNVYGISLSPSLTIAGTGSLEIDVVNTNNGAFENHPVAYGISCGGILTIESGTITSNATSNLAISNGYGISGNSVEIIGGTVNASGKGGNYSYGIYGNSLIFISGGTVNATGKSSSNSYGLSTNTLTVSGTADLTAKSEGGSSSQGAYADTMTVNGTPKITLISESGSGSCGLKIYGDSLRVNGISQMTMKGNTKALSISSEGSVYFAEEIKVLGGETLDAAPTVAYVDANRSDYKWITATGLSTITASAGAGGTISPSGEVKVDGGTSKTFTISANGGYSVSNVLVDGVNVGAISTYTFDDVGADHTISATFTANSSSPAVTTPPADEKKTDWTEVGKQLENAKEGDTVTVDMNGGTSVPAETLETIKGKDIDLVLDMGDGMVWTINGKNITNAQNVDLGMKKNAMTIPVEVTNKITGETKMLQLSFEYDGELGFTATLTIELGDDVDGLFANLMLFNSETETLEFVASAKISGGKTSLPFSHFSDWAIYVDSVDYAAGVPNADTEQSTTAEEETGKGDNTSTGVSVLPIGLLAVGSLVAAIAFKKRGE